MRWAILDTNIYIDHWERGRYEAVLAAVQKAFIVRQSSVVLSELRRGARTGTAPRLVESLFRLVSVQWAPTSADWWEAGRLIRTIGDRQHWNAAKRRDFQNDTLIALTARRYGAIIVTSDREDFSLLADELGIEVLTA